MIHIEHLPLWTCDLERLAAFYAEAVDALTTWMRVRGFEVVDGPRWTGDGCYESTALDPDGNRLERTI